MKKWIKRSIAALLLVPLSLLALLFILYVAINWKDEELRPEVQAALDWKLPEHALAPDNGYLIMLGMDAPAEQDATAVGKQRLEAELARYRTYLQTHTGEITTQPDYSLSKKLADTNIFCDQKKSENCIEFYLKQDTRKQAAILKEYRFLTDRFRAIRQSKNYVEVWPPYPYYSIPRYANLINAAKLEHIQAISEIAKGNTKAGIAHLTENAQFSRRFLANSDTLISHMVALAMVKGDMRILSELLAKYPELANYRKQLAQIVAPISTQEYSLNRTFQSERSFILPRLHEDLRDIHTTLKNNRDQEDSNTLSEFGGFVADKVTSLGLLRNATINLAYDLWELNLKLSSTEANDLDKALANAELQKEQLLGWGFAGFLYFRNPAGKILQLIAEPAYNDYIFKHHDTDGYVRLVALQLKLMADKVPASRIPQALDASVPEYRDPYTLLPMQWDAEHAELRFTGRYNSKNNDSKSNVYRVILPLQKS